MSTEKRPNDEKKKNHNTVLREATQKKMITWEISLGQKRLGRQACHLAWRRPSSMRRMPRPGSSVPEPWQSWHTRRRGRRCRTAGQLGICGTRSLHHRRQKGTRSQGTALSWDWSCSSEHRYRNKHTDFYLMWRCNHIIPSKVELDKAETV